MQSTSFPWNVSFFSQKLLKGKNALKRPIIVLLTTENVITSSILNEGSQICVLQIK